MSLQPSEGQSLWYQHFITFNKSFKTPTGRTLPILRARYSQRNRSTSLVNCMWTRHTCRSGSCGETLVYELDILRCTCGGNLEEENQEPVASLATGNFHQSLRHSPWFLFCLLYFQPKLNQPLTVKSSLFLFITSTSESMTEVPEVFRALKKIQNWITL